MSTASFAYQMVPKMFRILRHLKCILHRAAEAHHSELSRCSPEIVELPLPDQKMLAKAYAGAKTAHQLYHLDSRPIQILFICRTTYIYIYVCAYVYIYILWLPRVMNPKERTCGVVRTRIYGGFRGFWPLCFNWPSSSTVLNWPKELQESWPMMFQEGGMQLSLPVVQILSPWDAWRLEGSRGFFRLTDLNGSVCPEYCMGCHMISCLGQKLIT